MSKGKFKGFRIFAGIVFLTLTMTLGCSDDSFELPKKNEATNETVPKSKPNFITLVVDDMGFSDLGVYGSEIPTPNIDDLANGGVMLTNFYTGPMSAPSRSMLFSGTDNHPAGMGNVSAAITLRPEVQGQPGYEGVLSLDVPPFQEVLQNNGYHTMFTGKWDQGEEEEYYPINRGFTVTKAALHPGDAVHFSEVDGTIIPGRDGVDHPYFNSGEEIEKFPREFYSTDYYTDMAIEMLDERDKNKPFLLTVCYTAPHWPLQAPADAIAKYLDVYSKGWEIIRDQRFERMKQLSLGIGVQNYELPPLPDEVPAWDSLTEDERLYHAKVMAIYAAMIDILDQNIGRLIKHLKDIGEYENTVILVFSDNGASPKDRYNSNGAYPAWLKENFDNSYENLGNRHSFPGCTEGWAMVSNLPWNRYKGETYEGGVRTMAILHYAKSKSLIEGMKYGCITSIMDVAPTLIEMAGAQYPSSHNGKSLDPMMGVSMANLFDGDFMSCDTERRFGWEMNGCIGLRMGDWKLSQKWLGAFRFCEDKISLFNLADDPFERNDLSEERPAKFAEMMAAYEEFADKAGVVPVPQDPRPSD